MTTLRLDKLPDRTPVKYSITVTPDLSHALRDYAEIYRRVHGQKESVEDLIPFMLARFIEADAGFRKARRDLPAAGGAGTPGPSARPSMPTHPKAKGELK